MSKRHRGLLKRTCTTHTRNNLSTKTRIKMMDLSVKIEKSKAGHGGTRLQSQLLGD
jgi:hypothetical protein